MDVVKIGNFLKSLRKEKNLTQEQLGEILGVTNKTVSRWENGNYLPPVEILQLLSEFYGVSINEILCGERLSVTEYKEKAEENIVTALKSSAFTVPEKLNYFKRKWKKEHALEIVLESLAIFALMICGAIFENGLLTLGSVMAIFFAVILNNRMTAYAESRVFAEKTDEPLDKIK